MASEAPPEALPGGGGEQTPKALAPEAQAAAGAAVESAAPAANVGNHEAPKGSLAAAPASVAPAAQTFVKSLGDLKADLDEDLDDPDAAGTATLLGGRSPVSHRVPSPSPSPDGSTGRPGKRGRAKAKAEAADSKKAGHKKKLQKGMKTCKACKRPFDADGIKGETSFCADDKRALDRIYHMAKAMGGNTPAWLSDVRRDEEKVAKLLNNYWSRMGGRSKWKSKTPSGTKWSLAEYIESVRVTTGVKKRTCGKLMWRAEYYEHAATAAGGKLTEEEMTANWNMWTAKHEKDPEDPSITWDLDGPKKAPLRFWVQIGKFVDFESGYEHAKELTMTQKLKKDISEEEVEKFRLKAMTGHEQISAAGGGAIDFADMGRHMARESGDHADGAFVADTQRFGNANNLQELCPDTSEESEGEAQAGSKDRGGDQQDGARGVSDNDSRSKQGTPTKQEQAGWFDRDAKIAKAKKQGAEKVAELKTKLQSIVEDTKAEVQLTLKIAAEDRATLDDDVKIAQCRATACEKVLGDMADLEAYIRSFDRDMGAPVSAEVGRSPPCRLYASLVTLGRLTDLVSKYSAVADKDAMESVTRDFREQQKPIINLVGSATASTRDLSTQRMRVMEMVKKRRAAEDAGATDKRKRLEPPSNLAEFGPNYALQVQSIATVEALAAAGNDAREWTAPMIITRSAVAGIDDVLKSLQTDFKEMETVFTECAKKSKLKEQRGSVDIKSTDQKVVSECMSRCYPFETVQPGHAVEADLHTTLRVQVWAMTPNVLWCQAERAHLAALRLQARGSRFVMATPEENMMNFMRARTPGSIPTIAATWSYFKYISEDMLKTYSEAQGKDQIYTCTVNEGDTLFTPPGFLVADRGHGSTLNMGVKLGIVAKAHKGVLRKVYAELESKGLHLKGSAPTLKAAIDMCEGE